MAQGGKGAAVWRCLRSLRRCEPDQVRWVGIIASQPETGTPTDMKDVATRPGGDKPWPKSV